MTRGGVGNEGGTGEKEAAESMHMGVGESILQGIGLREKDPGIGGVGRQRRCCNSFQGSKMLTLTGQELHIGSEPKKRKRASGRRKRKASRASPLHHYLVWGKGVRETGCSNLFC